MQIILTVIYLALGTQSVQGDPDQTHKVLVLCRTASTACKVKFLTDIPGDLMDLRREQASHAGYTFFTTGVESVNLMVYY